MDRDQFIRQMQQFDFIRLVTPDLNGLHLCKLVPSRHAAKIADNECDAFVGTLGLGVDEIVAVPEVWKAHLPNGPLIPDRNTLRPLPWAGDTETKIAEVICETCWLRGAPVEAHPRRVARLQLERLHEMGFTLLSAFEAEFRAFQPGNQHAAPKSTKSGIYRTMTWLDYEPFMTRVDRQLRKAGIDMEDYSQEFGLAQLEISMVPRHGIETADTAFSFRQALKELALKEGFQVSFMTVPLPNTTGSGWHFNHSLLDSKTGKPVMFDPDAEEQLSEVMQHWIGGLMEHLISLTAIYSPTVNCYRRLHRDRAPHKANWDLNDRYKTVRVKNGGLNGTYVELRAPSSAACPYHVMAATVAAGIDGLRRQLKPPPRSEKGAPKLPRNLEESLNALESNQVMIDALGEQFIRWFVLTKREGCLKAMQHVDLSRDEVEAIVDERERYFLFI